MVSPADHVFGAGTTESDTASWRERWLRTRDRLLSAPAFQRWAASFPLTRPVARRNAKALFDLCAGFVYSQILSACVSLDLFSKLSGGPKPLDQLAGEMGMEREAARRLLDGAVALRLLARRQDGYGLGDLGAALQANPGVQAMIAHHALLYDDLRDPVALLREKAGETRLQRFWSYARNATPETLDASTVSDYSALMAASNGMVAEQVLAAYPVARHRRLLDVGGGAGAFLMAAGKTAPHLELMLFDLPAVGAIARQAIAQAGLSARTQIFGGDFFNDELPSGADLITLVRVLHDHDDDSAIAILRATRRALAEGGRLLIAEPLAATPGAVTVGDAYFGMYLTAMGSGRPRTLHALARLLKESGFQHVKEVSTAMPMIARVIVAQ